VTFKSSKFNTGLSNRWVQGRIYMVSSLHLCGPGKA